MAELGGMFDANNVEPNTPFVAIPPGDYSMQIIASAMEPTSAGTGRFLKLELEITDGEHAGRKTFDRLNLENPNSQAVEIAQRTLSAICRAVGVMTVSNSDQLHFKKMEVKLAVVPRKDKQGNVIQGEFSNEVKGYKPIGGSASGGQSGNQGGGAQQKSGFTPSGGGAPASSAPPWKRTG